MLNIYTLHEFSDWLQKTYNKIPHHNYVLYPDYLSLATLPEFYKEELRSHYANKLPDWQRNDLFAKLQVEYNSELLQKAKSFITAVDKARGLNYIDYIPELKDIL